VRRLLLPVVAACAPGTPPTGASIDGAMSIDAAAPVIRPDAAPLPPQETRLRIVNHCAEPIWIAHATALPDDQNVRLEPGAHHDYPIPASGLASARFWPKLGCDATGHACRIGDTGEGGGAPCGPGGCHPPIDSKFEVTFAPIGSGQATFYNLSLVDGYTLPFAVTPVGPGAGDGGCTVSDCGALTLDACPRAEDLGLGHDDVDLRIDDGCLSPCKAWHYPPPYGLGRPESEEPGRHLCCPAPMTPEACRDTSDPLSVEHTDFVALIHDACPTAYAYSYDDAAGLHACPSTTGFEVVFCP
jgi:hypothetical protein